MLKSKLSVITAVYNGSDYIEETVNSVLKCCSGIDFEYIVLNDGSTDTTLEILKSMKIKFALLIKAILVNPNLFQLDSKKQMVIYCLL